MSDYDFVFYLIGFFLLVYGVSYFFVFNVPSQIKYDPFCKSVGYDSLFYYADYGYVDSDNAITCERNVMYKGEVVRNEKADFSIIDYADWRETK